MSMPNKGPMDTCRTPNELTKLILKLTDRESLLKFARTSNARNAIAIPILFNHVDTGVRLQHDTSPDESGLSSDDLDIDMSDIHRNDSIQRARTLLIRFRQSDNYSHVRTMCVVCLPEAMEENMKLVEMVMPNIRGLELKRPKSGDGLGIDRSTRVTFEDLLLRMTLTPGNIFIALTTIRLGRDTTYYIECIPLLCRLAPNLLQLGMSSDYIMIPSALDDPTQPQFPTTFVDNTKIKQLYFNFCCFPTASIGFNPFQTFVDFLDHSPEASQVFFGGSDWLEGTLPSVEPHLATMPNLLDLHWPLVRGFSGMAGFENLRRLVVQQCTWDDPVRHASCHDEN